MAEQIGVLHLCQNPELYEVARNNNFEFIIHFQDKRHTDPLARAGIIDPNGEADFISPDKGQEVARLSVIETSVPQFKQDEIVISRGNTKAYFAGTPTFGSGTLKVNDFIGADTKSVLMAWQRLSYDVNSEKVGRAADYKRNCTLVEYTPDYEMVRYWTLEGCWVVELSEGNFNMEDGGKRAITATIRYDRAIPHLPDEEIAG